MNRAYKRQKQQIVTQMLKAISSFSLIEEGNRILIALSGGKDSSLLAYMLRDFSRWYEKPFTLAAVNIKTDITCRGCAKEQNIRDFAGSIDIPLEVRKIKIREVLKEGQEPDCFLCSWNRRKAIFQYATEGGFNKIAFGHHRDDFAETALMNLFYCGDFVSMAPRQVMFDGKFSIIRPLLFVPEKRIKAMVHRLGIICSPCLCPYGETSKRNWIKNFLKDTERESTQIKTNIFRSALSRILEMEGGFTPKRRQKSELQEEREGPLSLQFRVR